MNALGVAFSTAGGLALFLYGLRILSDGLKRALGRRMRGLLERITGRAYRGVIVGALASGILQSSSMTMVLLIGLINAGILTLTQGVGVMLGSEIGTTLTAQMIAFKIGNYYLPILACGFLLGEVFRGKRAGDVGRVILGFGLLFLGMTVMSSGLRGLAESEVILGLLEACGSSVLLGVGVGTAVTAIIQSSSAMTAMVIAMGAAGIITLPAAVALILGANIGTTVTGVIASFGASLSSRRLAAAQVVVNLAGVLLFLPVVVPYAQFVAGTASTLTRQIANAHTFFNVLVTLVSLAAVGGLVWIATRIVPGREAAIDTTPRFLGDEFLRTPSLAVDQAGREVRQMGELTRQMLTACRDGLIDRDESQTGLVLLIEEGVDGLQRAIEGFLDRVDSGQLPEREARRLHVLLHVTGDIERVGDHAVNIGERASLCLRQNLRLSEQAIRELDHMFDKTIAVYARALDALGSEDRSVAEWVLEAEKEIDQLEMRYKENHIRRLRQMQCDATAGILFVEILRNLERIGDHAVNIAGDVLLI